MSEFLAARNKERQAEGKVQEGEVTEELEEPPQPETLGEAEIVELAETVKAAEALSIAEQEAHFMTGMATPADVRRIIKEVIGDAGPAAPGQAQPTLLDRLSALKKRSEVGRPPGPEVFRGNSTENPTTWVSRIQDYIALQGYQTDIEKMRIVKMFLADRALIWYEGLLPVQRRNMQNFLAAFAAKYQTPEATYAAAQALTDRKQGPNEDPEDYITDVVLKGHMLGWDNARIQQQLINGLNASYKSQVIMARPEGLDQTCSVIMTARHAASYQTKELEGIQAALKELSSNIKTANDERKIAPAPVINPVASDPAPQKRPRRQGGYRPVVPIVITNDRQVPARNYGPRGGPPADQRFPSRQNQGGNACWTCGALDHFAANCPQTAMPANITCFRCGIVGHISRMCPMNTNFQRRTGPGRGGFRQNPRNQGN